MRLLSYHTDNGWRGALVVERDGDRPVRVVDIEAAARSAGISPAPVAVREVVERSQGHWPELAAAADDLRDSTPGAVLECADLLIGPPIPDPDKIVLLGLNYSDHAEEAGLPEPPSPLLFAKYRNALIGPTEPLFLPTPDVSDEVDWEGELAVVIGRRAESVSESDAMTYVAGYTVMNDVSARDLQRATGQWLAGKSLDGFAPCGPTLVSTDEIADPHDLLVQTLVNGEVMQSGTTGKMIFRIAETIAYISRVMTLVPGDIIATGTPAGVGSKRTPPVFLHPGDVVTVEIEGVGTVATPVRSAADKPAVVV